VLGLFVVYAVYQPRRHNLGNTAAYAQSCLSGVLDWLYNRHGRRPGPVSGFIRSRTLLLRGLHKVSPSEPKAARLPILAMHLRAIRACLDLTGNARHRAFISAVGKASGARVI